MANQEEILYLFHHIHHADGEHEVHHCGGEHKAVNPELNYQIKHCPCGQHSIDKETAVGHATSPDLQPVSVKIKFLEKCPSNGWHIESGVKIG